MNPHAYTIEYLPFQQQRELVNAVLRMGDAELYSLHPLHRAHASALKSALQMSEEDVQRLQPGARDDVMNKRRICSTLF